MVDLPRLLYIILCLYVDDLVCGENWKSRFNKFMPFLESRIEITNEGALRWYLSVKWTFNADASCIIATMAPYIEKVVRVFDIDPDLSKGPR